MNHVVFPGQTVPSSVRWLCIVKPGSHFLCQQWSSDWDCSAERHHTRTWPHLLWETEWGRAGSVFAGTCFRWEPRKVSGRDNNFSLCSTAVFDENTSVENSNLMISLLFSQENHLVEDNFIFFFMNKQQDTTTKFQKKGRRRFIRSSFLCQEVKINESIFFSPQMNNY